MDNPESILLLRGLVTQEEFRPFVKRVENFMTATADQLAALKAAEQQNESLTNQVLGVAQQLASQLGTLTTQLQQVGPDDSDAVVQITNDMAATNEKLQATLASVTGTVTNTGTTTAGGTSTNTAPTGTTPTVTGGGSDPTTVSGGTGTDTVISGTGTSTITGS